MIGRFWIKICITITMSIFTMTIQSMEKDVVVNSEGWWPFKNYYAFFPRVALNHDLNEKYSISRMGSNDFIHLKLLLHSDEEVQFLDFDPVIEIEVSTPSKQVLTTESRVFSHYFRMLEAGESLWPTPSEWKCRFNWKSKNSSKAVPFSKKLPDKSNELVCSLIMDNPKDAMIVDVECHGCEADNPLYMGITLSSGWK